MFYAKTIIHEHTLLQAISSSMWSDLTDEEVQIKFSDGKLI